MDKVRPSASRRGESQSESLGESEVVQQNELACEGRGFAF